jgi:hypothetical protein
LLQIRRYLIVFEWVRIFFEMVDVILCEIKRWILLPFLRWLWSIRWGIFFIVVLSITSEWAKRHFGTPSLDDAVQYWIKLRATWHNNY